MQIVPFFLNQAGAPRCARPLRRKQKGIVFTQTLPTSVPQVKLRLADHLTDKHFFIIGKIKLESPPPPTPWDNKAI
ncbi:MAG: hypothetical protein JO171_12320 [Paludibacterium sp.]|uniref:hypothetical protein n=1 Tax=Paludibacterium sp. TaxID=1917523 RepID=UPI0025E2A9E0|nr:hypothetical protein [Paludibacterium sp.]MBV8047937.1 hypothetical protein [Paludibacterium sp.]MBV8647214.1 hypothetical protein [Paludibacterium sp.]